MSAVKLYWHYDQYTSFLDSAKEYVSALRQIDVHLQNEPCFSDVAVLQGSPDTVLQCYQSFPELRNRYVVGFVQWEADQLQGWQIAALAKVNEIWTSSTYCYHVFKKYFSNVFIIPHITNPRWNVCDTALQPIEQIRTKSPCSPFFFYSIVNKFEPRKNFQAAITAFCEAQLGPAAFLIVKTHTLHQASRKLPNSNVVLIDDWLTKSEIARLHQQCQVYVSAHRSEGWGLGLSDAMAYGNLVIATNYSGNTDYMNNNNSLLVDYDIRAIGQETASAQPRLWSPQMKWAEIRVDDLIEKLRLAFYQYESLSYLRTQAKQDMKQYAPEKIAAIILKQLVRISETLI